MFPVFALPPACAPETRESVPARCVPCVYYIVIADIPGPHYPQVSAPYEFQVPATSPRDRSRSGPDFPHDER